jgi:23S rRNA pseudouridine1911/1915/1917 synthase
MALKEHKFLTLPKNITLSESIKKNILYEDNHLIIINKMASEIVQGDKTGDKPLSDKVKDYIKVKYSKQGEVFIGVVHRLDRPVSGAVIFARTSKALTRLNSMLKNREIHKTYWAIVRNKPPENEAHLADYLKKNEKLNKSFVVNSKTPGALKAELDYRIIGQSKSFCLLEIILHTGRHHQIRVQLSNIGCPVKGDLKYGDTRPNPDASICLHSRKTEFIHPVSKKNIEVIAPLPQTRDWQIFT